ncbi:MAG TPA: hypothetical protein VH108_00945 [Gaiellaceae bacterium]|nr:hypothetical protein [Gaiellaceae bacterium]
MLILAGCGGSGEPKGHYQRVAGRGFSFGAPAGWRIEHAVGHISASSDSQLVQVSTFPLVHPYRDSLFGAVANELAVRMKALAKETGGVLEGTSTVTAGGIRSHVYEMKVGDHIDAYTFVLRGSREYQLLCRRSSSTSDAFCKHLITSFAVA